MERLDDGTIDSESLVEDGSNPKRKRGERKKKKKNSNNKNNEEKESQRLSHIAVERDRRRQMNAYFKDLHSLIPPNSIQRADQGSILSAAIEYVRELEQLQQSLEAQKKEKMMTTMKSVGSGGNKPFSVPVQGTAMMIDGKSKGDCSERVETEVMGVVEERVNIRVRCERRRGELVKAISAMENLGIKVMHLHIASCSLEKEEQSSSSSSSSSSVLYSFTLKIEDECRLRSVDEVASAAHHIFSFISTSGDFDP